MSPVLLLTSLLSDCRGPVTGVAALLCTMLSMWCTVVMVRVLLARCVLCMVTMVLTSSFSLLYVLSSRLLLLKTLPVEMLGESDEVELGSLTNAVQLIPLSPCSTGMMALLGVLLALKMEQVRLFILAWQAW